jgi:hypothetical protein
MGYVRILLGVGDGHVRARMKGRKISAAEIWELERNEWADEG